MYAVRKQELELAEEAETPTECSGNVYMENNAKVRTKLENYAL